MEQYIFQFIVQKKMYLFSILHDFKTLYDSRRLQDYAERECVTRDWLVYARSGMIAQASDFREFFCQSTWRDKISKLSANCWFWLLCCDILIRELFHFVRDFSRHFCP